MGSQRATDGEFKGDSAALAERQRKLLRDRKSIVVSLLVSLVYRAESTVRWIVVREKHCSIAADSRHAWVLCSRASRHSTAGQQHRRTALQQLRFICDAWMMDGLHITDCVVQIPEPLETWNRKL
jgi:hypothetical protein